LRCLQLNPYHPYATNNMAYTYLLLKEYKKAAEACERCFETNNVANNYFRNWAVALMYLNNYQEAVEQIKRAIDIEPRNASKRERFTEKKIGWCGERS
jgi:tetratricopeptide (TPR) repeat protein